MPPTRLRLAEAERMTVVIVTIDLAPMGDDTKTRPLGRIAIANDGTGDKQRGNYVAELSHAGKFYGKPGAWKAARVEGFNREMSPYHLLLLVLRQALEPRRPAPAALDAWYEAFEERAAILEYDGGLSREDAERKALELVGPPRRVSQPGG